MVVSNISLGGRPFRSVSGIGASFLLLCLFEFEVLQSVRACLVGVLHDFFKFLSPCLAFHISMGLGRSSVLRIRSNSIEASGSGQTSGESYSLAVVVHRDAPREPPSPLGKGKGKISEIRYSSSFEYLRVTIQNAEAVGPSRVEPLYGEIFAAQYGLPFGVQVWCLDVLTSYVI